MRLGFVTLKGRCIHTPPLHGSKMFWPTLTQDSASLHPGLQIFRPAGADTMPPQKSQEILNFREHGEFMNSKHKREIKEIGHFFLAEGGSVSVKENYEFLTQMLKAGLS